MDASWPDNIEEAIKLQKALKKLIRLEPILAPPALIAGCDASYSEGKVIGAVCLYRYPEIELIQRAVFHEQCRFPYVPGYLSFREGAALMGAIHKLNSRPDVLMFDGQGIAHPRGMGIASHLGVLLDIPSVGCAKSRLVGTCSEPGRAKGAQSALKFDGRMIGVVLRTRTDVRPVFVSPGHRVDIRGAVDLVLKCTGKYRLPEPIRCAHKVAEGQKGPRT
jgi:deoxyribonuclease V